MTYALDPPTPTSASLAHLRATRANPKPPHPRGRTRSRSAWLGRLPGRPDGVGGALMFADAGHFLPRPLHAHESGAQPSQTRTAGDLRAAAEGSPGRSSEPQPSLPTGRIWGQTRNSQGRAPQPTTGVRGRDFPARPWEEGRARGGARAQRSWGPRVAGDDSQRAGGHSPCRARKSRPESIPDGRHGAVENGGTAGEQSGWADRAPPPASHPAWPARGAPSGRGPPGLGTRLARNSYLLPLPRLPPPAGPRPAITRGRPAPPRPRASGRVWGKARKNVASP